MGLKKNVASYKKGGDFPPSMLNNDVNGGDRMAMDYMDRQRSPQPQSQQQINNEVRATTSTEAPFIASDGSTWQYNGSEYVKIADADQSKAYDPTVAPSMESETPTQSKSIEAEGAAAKRYSDYAKSTYKDNAKIYGSDIDGLNEIYDKSKTIRGVSSNSRPVEFMPKYAYESLPESMKKEADKKLEKGLLQITGEEISDKRTINYSDEGMDVTKKRGTPELDMNYVAPLKLSQKQQEVKAVKTANKEQPKISTPVARVEYKRPDSGKSSIDNLEPTIGVTAGNQKDIESKIDTFKSFKPKSESSQREAILTQLAKQKGVKFTINPTGYAIQYKIDGKGFSNLKEAEDYLQAL